MTQSVSLSLPLSATALRLGATLLTELAAQTEVIYAELNGRVIGYAHGGPVTKTPAADTFTLDPAERIIVKNQIEPMHSDPNPQQVQRAEQTTLEQDVTTAEADTGIETPEQRQYRLHGNVASAGMEPAPVITQETLPPFEYETVVTGYAPGPVPFAAGHDQGSYTAAGWTVEAMVNAGHLAEVLDRIPLAVAPGVSPAPSAPAPAPAPAPSGVELDIHGLPWDSRVNSDAAVRKAATGAWKTRKNLAPGYKEQIEAELRAVMNAGKDPAVSATTTTVVVAAPPAPSAPIPAPAPAAPAAASGNPFADFTRWLIGHTKAGKLSQTDAVLEIQKQGLTQIPDLAKRPDLIPSVMAALTLAKGL